MQQINLLFEQCVCWPNMEYKNVSMGAQIELHFSFRNYFLASQKCVAFQTFYQQNNQIGCLVNNQWCVQHANQLDLFGGNELLPAMSEFTICIRLSIVCVYKEKSTFNYCDTWHHLNIATVRILWSSTFNCAIFFSANCLSGGPDPVVFLNHHHQRLTLPHFIDDDIIGWSRVYLCGADGKRVFIIVFQISINAMHKIPIEYMVHFSIINYSQFTLYVQFDCWMVDNLNEWNR